MRSGHAPIHHNYLQCSSRATHVMKATIFCLFAVGPLGEGARRPSDACARARLITCIFEDAAEDDLGDVSSLACPPLGVIPAKLTRSQSASPLSPRNFPLRYPTPTPVREEAS